MIAAPWGAVVPVRVALHQAACSNVVVGDGVSSLRVSGQCFACLWRVSKALLVLVSFHVQGQVVRSGKGARADGALEGLGARVLPVVARQLIWTGETPVAAVPRASVRLLTCRTGRKRKAGMSQSSGKWSETQLRFSLDLQRSMTKSRCTHNDDTDHH